ncbi:MAG: hypothetical protein KDC45_15285 [Bacteroidetes bacterium]|nr:hypothetical protein [Bacteroidota bacterium]
MDDFQCVHEEEVQNASRRGTWPVELQRHAHTCRHCRDTRWIVESFQRLAKQTAATYEPQSAASLLTVAAWEKQKAAEVDWKTQRSTVFMVCLTCLAGLITVLFWTYGWRPNLLTAGRFALPFFMIIGWWLLTERPRYGRLAT